MSFDFERVRIRSVWSRSDWSGEFNKANGTGKARVGEDACIGINAEHAKARRGEEVENFQSQVLDAGQARTPAHEADASKGIELHAAMHKYALQPLEYAAHSSVSNGIERFAFDFRAGEIRFARERKSCSSRRAVSGWVYPCRMSASAFAAMAGIKYPTFANWLQKRRKAQSSAKERPSEVGTDGGPIRLWEGVVEDPAMPASGGSAGLLIELPGAVRLGHRTL